MASDAELIGAVLGGEREAYATLVRRYERAVCAATRAVLRDRHAAEDAAQEAFVTAYRKLGSLRRPAAFGAWLLRIARRQALRAARRPQPAAWPAGADAAQPTPPETLDEELLAAVLRLPEHEAQVVTLRYFDGHSVQAVAQITGRPLGTVTKQLSRAHARLRARLKGVSHDP